MPFKGTNHPFIDEFVSRAPDSPGVYQLETPSEVVYIGMAEDSIRARLRNHLEGSGVDCVRTATRVRVEVHASPAARLRELLRENLLATGHLPKCNDLISGSHRLRYRHT
jgi:excinuclease UvrABC nuclease subunit